MRRDSSLTAIGNRHLLVIEKCVVVRLIYGSIGQNAVGRQINLHMVDRILVRNRLFDQVELTKRENLCIPDDQRREAVT